MSSAQQIRETYLNQPGIPVAELAQKMNCSKQQIYNALSDARRKGFFQEYFEENPGTMKVVVSKFVNNTDNDDLESISKALGIKKAQARAALAQARIAEKRNSQLLKDFPPNGEKENKEAEKTFDLNGFNEQAIMLLKKYGFEDTEEILNDLGEISNNIEEIRSNIQAVRELKNQLEDLT